MPRGYYAPEVCYQAGRHGPLLRKLAGGLRDRATGEREIRSHLVVITDGTKAGLLIFGKQHQ